MDAGVRGPQDPGAAFPAPQAGATGRAAGTFYPAGGHGLFKGRKRRRAFFLLGENCGPGQRGRSPVKFPTGSCREDRHLSDRRISCSAGTQGAQSGPA